jgi:hypothetical protein
LLTQGSHGSHRTPLHPLTDPLGPLKTQYNPLKPLLGPPDFGLWDLWLSESYHPRGTAWAVGHAIVRTAGASRSLAAA